MRQRQKENIKLVSVVAISATIITKILGLLREMMISGALGASPESDAYNISYMLVITIFGLFSSAYSNSLVPTAAKLYSQEKEKLNSIVSSIVTISVVFTSLIVIAMHVVPRGFVFLLASGAEEETIEIAVNLIKISSWSLIALILESAYGIILMMFDKNVAPSLANIVFPIPILILLVMGCRSVKILILGVVVGYFAQTLILMRCALNTSFRYRPSISWKSRYIYDFFAMMPPMLVSSGLLQINTLVDNQVASGFGVGSVTALQQASKVNALAYTVFSTALMQIIYAKLTKAYVKGDKDNFVQMIKQQVKLILFFIIPCAIIIPLYSNEIIEMLFLRGSYTVEAAKIAGSILKGYGLGLVIFVLRDIFVYIYYSAQNSKFPSMVNCIAVGVNVVLNLLLSHYMGIRGIAYATSLSACVSLFILAVFVKKKVMPIKIIEKRDAANIGIATIICFLFLKTAKAFTENHNVWLNVIAFAGGFIVYWAVIILEEKLLRKKL